MASKVKQVKVLSEPNLELNLQGHKSWVTCVSFDPEAKLLASGSKDLSVVVWDLHDDTRAKNFIGHKEEITDICCSPRGNLVATSSRDGSVRLWAVNGNEKACSYQGFNHICRSVHFSDDGLKLVISVDDKTVKEWDVKYRRCTANYTGHTNWVTCARMSNNCRMIGSVSDDKTIKLFDRRSKCCIHTFRELVGCPKKISFHPDDTCIAVGFTNNFVKIFDTKMMKQRQVYECHEDIVTSVEFHPFGNYLFSTSYDSTVKVLDLLEGRPIYTIKGHKAYVLDVAVSKDGNYFATAGTDEVKVWRTKFTDIEDLDVDTNKWNKDFKFKEVFLSIPKETSDEDEKSESSPKLTSGNNTLAESSESGNEDTNSYKINQLVSKLDSLSTLMMEMNKRLKIVEQKCDKFSKYINESGF